MIATEERDSILSLIKFFNDHWTIVDVGSNKLDWSEALMIYRDSSTEAYKYTVYSFEPNDKLLSYQQVKFDYNDNIIYNGLAVYKESGKELDFWYWENRNNGLSSILLNPKWEEELGHLRNHKKVKTIALDDFDFNCKEIDIIKIDVEGAESYVLEGCLEILRNKKVRFIQVEYSEHYKVAGREFKGILNFIEQFGYSAWSWDGKNWNKINKEEFIEDYRLENFMLTYKDINKGPRDYINFQYTQLWNSEFIKNTEFLKGKVKFALEIGCFEGLTSNYICDSLLIKNGKTRMICVDPLINGVYLEDHKDNSIFEGQYERFINNTKDQPIELQRLTSKDALPLLQNYKFDFMYIDGDHTEDGVYFDASSYIPLLRVGGYMLLDDYGQSDETKRGVDRFLEQMKGNIEIVVKDYQVMIRKIVS